MADTGVKTVTSYNDVNSFWNNEGNIVADDATFADCSPSRNGTAQLQVFFDLSGIPSGATIDGIILTVHGKVDNTSLALYALAIDDVENTLGTAKSTTFSLENTEQTKTFGGSTDTWGISSFANWTGGMAIYFYKTVITLMTGYVDYVTLQVYYSTASGLANLKTVNGLAVASVKTLRSNSLIASSKTFNGLT